MALSYEFYLARAQEAASEADAASLDNVRDRARRSEHAWRDMANRALKVERDRETARIDREQRIAAERALHGS
jgi:hypothetical protein